MTRPEIFILTTEPPERPGGVERFVSTFMALAERHGYKVRVFHRENCASPRWRNLNPSRKIEWFLAGLLQGYYIGKAARKALHSGVQLVLSNSTVGWFPLGDKVKQVHFYHGTYRGQAEAIRPFITRRGYLKLKWWDSMVLERWSGKGKQVLCNSDQTREEVRKFFRIHGTTIWLPLDTKHFCPKDRAKCRQELGLAENRPVGLFVGSTHPQKGFPIVQFLIRSFPQIQWVLALRGATATDQDLNEKNVRLFQNASYEQLPLLYNAADFSLCPSRYEPFGYVVAEALACGLPVIATPGGVSHLFLSSPSLDQFLIKDPDDKRAFLDAVSEILSNPKGYRQVVLKTVRPHLEELMAPENWWRRFCSVMGVKENA
jgi:glycosyltransferase involved in cell wall biosynthesis